MSVRTDIKHAKKELELALDPETVDPWVHVDEAYDILDELSDE